jgi:hypothetical protein
MTRRLQEIATRVPDAAHVLVVLPFLVVATTFAVDHAGALYDDAYIYFRYADNIVQGCGLRYNCTDPPVEGFSSALYLAVLVAARAWTKNLELVALVVGHFAILATLVAAVQGANRLAAGSRARRIVAGAGTAALLGMDQLFLLNAVIGMDTALAAWVTTALLVSAAYGAKWLRTLLVLAVLTRPECIVFALALPILPRARSLRYLAPLALALLLLTLSRLSLFGDFLPNPFWAKAGGGSAHLRFGFAYLREVVSAFPAIVLAPLALANKKTRAVAGWFLAGSVVWLASVVHAGGDHFLYGRLVVPLVPSFTALAVAGISGAMDRWPPRVRRIDVFACAVTGVISMAVATWTWLEQRVAPVHGFDNVSRWKAVGAWLRKNHPGATIATVPIGAIGYYSAAPIVLDEVGLTQRAIAHSGNSVPEKMLIRKWIGHERYDTAFVLGEAPDLIVMTTFRTTPWTSLDETTAGVFAEWLLLREIKAGRAPYELHDAEVARGLHWLMFTRRASSPQ